MTWRRWQYAGTEHEEKAPGVGPVETDVALELEKLGYSPLTPAGPLRTAAVRALMLAETYDHTHAAAALPGLDRQLGAVMAEARQAVEQSPMPKPAGSQPEEVDEFTRKREERRGPPDRPPTGTEDK